MAPGSARRLFEIRMRNDDDPCESLEPDVRQEELDRQNLSTESILLTLSQQFRFLARYFPGTSWQYDSDTPSDGPASTSTKRSNSNPAQHKFQSWRIEESESSNHV